MFTYADQQQQEQQPRATPVRGLRGGSSLDARKLDIGGCFNFETCGGGSSPPQDQHEWTGRTQDGQPLANCGSVFRSAHATATGLRCFGSHCSAMEMRCTDTVATNNQDRVQDVYWTNRFSEETGSGSGQSFCAEDYFVTGVSCDGQRCDNVSIECTKVFGRHHVQDSCYWTDPVSEENGGELQLPEGFFIRGMDCDDGFCDNKRFWACQESLDDNRPSQFEERSPFQEQTDVTTDGLEPVTCGSLYTLGRVLVSGFQCSGRYCDDLRLQCHRPSNSRISDTVDHVYWTHIFSEEHGGRVTCPKNYFMTGIHCDGDYCDNLSMECTRVVGRGQTNCAWTSGTVSEENGGNLSLGNNKYIAGIDCDGRYCDNKRLFACEPEYN